MTQQRYTAGTFGDSHAAAVEAAPPWVLVQERRILVELVREVQCHRVRSRDCRICQLKDEFDKLNPSQGVVA